MVNYSLIINDMKGFVYYNQGCDIAVLRRIATSRGCSENDAESCINGVIRDIISNNVSPKDCNVSYIDPNGEKVKVPQYNPTQDELMEFITKKVKGITDDRAQAIIRKMLEKGFLSEVPTNQKLYRGTMPLPNLPFNLD